MPTRLLSDLQTLRENASEAETKYYESLIAKRYRDAYDVLEAQLAKLYAQMGDNPSLQEARRYGRLDKLRKAIAEEYRALTKYNIEVTRQSSASSYADAYYGNAWAYDQAVGVELKWPTLSVEAIRASVWSGATGENFSERLKHWDTREVLALDQKITQGLALGYGYPKVARNVKQEVADDFSRIMRIVRTEAHRNYNQGHLEVYRQLDEVGVQARKQWVSTLDTRTRDAHGSLDGEFADDDGLFHTHGASAEAPGLFGVAEEDINCIPEYAIPVCMNTEKLYKRNYSGSIVIIKTSSGNEIHVTPIHPILTDKGWVAAKSIVKDSNVCSVVLGEIFGSGNPNVNNKPPIAAEILNLFSVVGSVKRVSGVDKQFHGDGYTGDSNVDVISLDGKLRDYIESFIYKPLREFRFTSTNVLHSRLPSNSSLYKFIGRSFHAFNGFMRFIGKPLTLLWTGISHTLKHGLRSITRHNVTACEYATYPSAMDVKGVCDTFFGFPFQVSFDNVVSVEQIPFTGHVYNLQTKQGWYGVYHDNGNMSIVHNCRCRVIEVIDGFAPELRRIRGEGIVPYTTFKDWAGSRGWSESKGWPIEAKTKLAIEQTIGY